MASAEPYAKHCTSLQAEPHQHLTTHFLQAGYSSCCPTVSKHWRPMFNLLFM